MSKVAVVYASTTGNTEKMAEAVAEGAKSKGAEVVVLTADGAVLVQDGVMANYEPDDGALAQCKALGEALA